MTRYNKIAVLDVGKTNAKIALVDAGTLEEIAVEKRPNTVLAGPPWPHFDLDGHWRFFLDRLKDLQARYGVDAISITTHGASAVLLHASGALAAPMLDYEHHGPEETAAAYDALRPDFAETGSPRLGMGLNVGAQLFWQFSTDPGLFDRTAHILTYPQYWAYRLTGVLASDVTSLGCHTDLWNPWTGTPSSLVDRLGIGEKLAPPRRPFDILGAVSPEVAAATGLSPDTPVSCGIHDSNASLLPYLFGREPSFSVVSTGTWVIVMSMGEGRPALDPARDTLVNVNAFGQPVASARFMGGREYELIASGHETAVTAADREAVLSGGLMLMPAVEPGSGPFQNRPGGFTKEPATDGQRLVALSYYLALMTDTCLGLVAAAGPVIIEGPFARNGDFLAMLAALRPEGVAVAHSTTGTSIGSALLLADDPRGPATESVVAEDVERLRAYAENWWAALG